MIATFPPFLLDMLAHPPAAGTGVNNWLFRVSRQLHAHLPAMEIVRTLRDATRNCGRPVPEREIVRAVQNALPCAWARPGATRTAPAASKWPAVNQERREAIASDGFTLAELAELSPVKHGQTEEIIDRLFPGNPWLCCGASKSVFDTKRREEFRGALSKLALIVPSPMTGKWGVTQEGKPSMHTNSNTGPRRFLICEFDKGTTDEQSALLRNLGNYAPLVLAVHSGGKSMHGWFFIEGWPDERIMKFFRYAISIGADPATWTRCQFVRMPGGTRDNGRPQTVYFFNPEPLEVK